MTKIQRPRSIKRKRQPLLLSGTDPLIGLFIQSLSETYPSDPTRPSLICGWLPGKAMYYVSIVRYREIYGKNSYTVASVSNEDLIVALNQLISGWKAKFNPSKEATEKLFDLI